MLSVSEEVVMDFTLHQDSTTLIFYNEIYHCLSLDSKAKMQ